MGAVQAHPEKNPHSKNGFVGVGEAAAAWPVHAAAGSRLHSAAVALMFASATYRAGRVESSESNSFHTYLMLQ